MLRGHGIYRFNLMVRMLGKHQLLKSVQPFTDLSRHRQRSLPIPAAVSFAACRGLQDGCWYRTSHLQLAGSISFFPAHADPRLTSVSRLNSFSTIALAHSPPTEPEPIQVPCFARQKIIVPGKINYFLSSILTGLFHDSI